MAAYDNSRYTYEEVLEGKGFYKKDDLLRYSEGVKKMQTRLNSINFNCGTPDGKFGSGTESQVKNFQSSKGLTVDGAAGQDTLTWLDAEYNGGSYTGGEYSVYFNPVDKRFATNQQAVYVTLKNAGLNNYAIAGIMGNIHAESEFNPTWTNTTAVGICQWQGERKTNLEKYATNISQSKSNIFTQAQFILEEFDSNSNYYDSTARKCYTAFKNGTTNTVKKAADYFTALYERCENYSTWANVETACKGSSYLTLDRFSKESNIYNGKYYIDTPKRRGYAESYYACILKI